MSRLAVVALVAACGGSPPARAPIAPVGEGIAIAIYTSSDRTYGVVDDRRMIDVTNGTILLDRIDPAAALQSLVIEPLDDDSLHILSCVRERVDDSDAALAQLAEARGERPRRVIVVHDQADTSAERFHFENTNAMEPAILPNPSVLSPLVRCRVAGKAGKHRVRVLHVTSTLTFTTQHDLTMTDPATARVTTRFAIATPTWRTRATVTLYAGVPGNNETPPHALATEPIILDGSTAIIATAPRDVPARLRSVYAGIKLEDSDDVEPMDIVWGRESRHQVWLWLEIADPSIANGPVHAHIALPTHPEREIAVAVDQLDKTTDHARIPLWIDEDLLGTRRRSIDRADGVTITDRIQLSVANLGTVAREVWVEERLRSAKRRSISQSWPTRPQLAKDIARTKLTLAPGTTERLGFTIDYEL